MTGAVNWLTVTVKRQDLEFRALSKTTQFTIVDPKAKELPVGGLQVLFKIPDPSVAATLYVATPVTPESSGMMF